MIITINCNHIVARLITTTCVMVPVRLHGKKHLKKHWSPSCIIMCTTVGLRHMQCNTKLRTQLLDQLQQLARVLSVSVLVPNGDSLRGSIPIFIGNGTHILPKHIYVSDVFYFANHNKVVKTWSEN
jgi:hypothetical protein